MLALSAPVLVLTRWLSDREESDEEAEEDREASEDEIDTFLDEAEEEGIIEKDEDELLRSVVEFGDTIVREIMTPRVDMVCIRKDATIQKLRNLIITEKYSRIPVYTNRVDNLDGMVMAKDLLAYSEKEFDAAPIEPLIRPVIFVPESMMVSDLLNEFQKGMQKMAIVVDEHGGVTGLVTMEDVVEEIVGEIHDEYDTEEAQIAEVGAERVPRLGRGQGRGDRGPARRRARRGRFHHRERPDHPSISGGCRRRAKRLRFEGGLTVEILDVDQKRIKKVRFRKE